VRPALVGAWLLAALAIHAGAHLGLVAGLARRSPRWRAAAALFVPPLAPMWGWREGMEGRTYAWAIGLAAYAVAALAAR